MYTTRAEAQADADTMLGWNNIRVVVEEEPEGEEILGYDVIYIIATEPGTGRQVTFDGTSGYAAFDA